MLRLLGITLLLLLVGCPSSTPNPNPNPDVPTPAPSGDCTSVIRGSVDIPTQWVDGPAACDYLLEGVVRVNSTLSIEPGVTIRAALNALLVVKGADLSAVGTPDKRIVFEGQEHAPGYWEGITLSDARPSRIEYVDIKDAGQACSPQCDGGLLLKNTVTSLTNSTISNSFVNGLYIGTDTEFSAFSNNRFYGNSLAGISVFELSSVAALDFTSDYLGVEQPNGVPHIHLRGRFLTDKADRIWKNLNAPYLSPGITMKDGTLTLEPGAEMVFDGGSLQSDNGALKAVGTASNPIIFRSLEARREAWQGLFFDSTGSGKHVFEHVEIQDAWTGLFLKWGVDLKISNSSIKNSTNGITCDTLLFQPTILEVGENVSFETSKREISEGCNE